MLDSVGVLTVQPIAISSAGVFKADGNTPLNLPNLKFCAHKLFPLANYPYEKARGGGIVD